MNKPDQYTRALCKWLTDPDAEAAPAWTDARWNWDDFAHAAVESAVLPALYSNVASTRLREKLPNDISTLLSTVHTLNTDRNQTALRQVRALAAALNQSGIQPLALKGIANILTGIYPDLGCRYLTDVDLLVPEEQFPKAVSILKKLGYTANCAHPLELVIGHSYPPFNRADSIEIDLHRTPGLGACESLLTASELIRHSKVHNVDGALVRIPCPEHLVVHHIMHSQMHDVYRERLAPSVRTLYDFFLLQRRLQDVLDWSLIAARFRRSGQYATLCLYLLQIECSLGLVPPINIEVSGALELRRWRRRLLQQQPAFRYIDPLFYIQAGVRPRLRRLREIYSHPGGLCYLAGKLNSASFYARLRDNLQ